MTEPAPAPADASSSRAPGAPPAPRPLATPDLIALCVEHRRYREAATAVATELAIALGCERVAVGVRRHERIEVAALSQRSHFDRRGEGVRALARAMEEACDQDATLVHPAPRGAPARVTRAHAELVRSQGAGAFCTVPVACDGRLVGALGFERRFGRVFDAEALRALESITALVGPVLELKRAADAGTLARLRTRLADARVWLLGPERPATKLLLFGGLLGVLVLAALPGTHRVTAQARLEGRVQRAIVAGVDGFVAESHARAGDVVVEGELLGRLDERDLRLEQRRWAGRREQLRKEQREALAAFDRAELEIVAAKLEQAEAQLALLEENLARTRLAAPFAGVVVRGDLSQSLGSPVARGDVLFEVAPLDGYRVILEVEEGDLTHVAVEQRGRLALSALPGSTLDFAVDRVARVASAEAGHTFFRVEARLDGPVETLRPGMEGVAKIDAGRRALGWIATHRMLDWLRLWLWTWWP